MLDEPQRLSAANKFPARAPSVWLTAIFCIVLVSPTAWSDKPLPRSIDQISPGTLIQTTRKTKTASGVQGVNSDQGADAPSKIDFTKRWNQLILFAVTDLAHGDVDSVSETIRDAATKSNLVIQATISKKVANGKPEFELADLGVGYSIDINGRQTIVTGETVGQLGGSLGFIAKQVLKKNQAAMSDVKVVAETRTLQVFDAPSIFLINGSHERCFTRHLIWIDPKTGVGAMLIWIIKKGDSNSNRQAPVSNHECLNIPMRLIRLGVVEKRGIHVDGNEFTLGIPSDMAFALVDLTPGTNIAWTAAAKQIAGKPVYNAADVAGLSSALNQAISQTLGRK